MNLLSHDIPSDQTTKKVKAIFRKHIEQKYTKNSSKSMKGFLSGGVGGGVGGGEGGGEVGFGGGGMRGNSGISNQYGSGTGGYGSGGGAVWCDENADDITGGVVVDFQDIPVSTLTTTTANNNNNNTSSSSSSNSNSNSNSNGNGNDVSTLITAPIRIVTTRDTSIIPRYLPPPPAVRQGLTSSALASERKSSVEHLSMLCSNDAIQARHHQMKTDTYNRKKADLVHWQKHNESQRNKKLLRINKKWDQFQQLKVQARIDEEQAYHQSIQQHNNELIQAQRRYQNLVLKQKRNEILAEKVKKDEEDFKANLVQQQLQEETEQLQHVEDEEPTLPLNIEDEGDSTVPVPLQSIPPALPVVPVQVVDETAAVSEKEILQVNEVNEDEQMMQVDPPSLPPLPPLPVPPVVEEAPVVENELPQEEAPVEVLEVLEVPVTERVISHEASASQKEK